MRIGIFGGTFDPVHNGHVRAAECFREECGLDLVYVIPNSTPNLKERKVSPGEDRLNMLRLAFAGKEREGFVISDLELRRGGVSYTCDTVAELRKLHPDAQLYLFFGDDWLEGLPRWKNVRDLLANVTIALANRSGRDVSAPIHALEEEYGAKFHLLTFRALEASSTARRAGAESLCCEAVNRYIAEKGLYGDMKTLIETVRKDLRLSEKRMRHTEGVVQAAKLLAERHFPTEITPEEAELAALLHDYTKEYTAEQHLAVFERYGVQIAPEELKPRKLLHSRTAAVIAQYVYHAPEEVCSAVRWHTTGRAAMSPLELVIYFADYIEEGRTHPSCVRLRKYYEKEYRTRKDGMRALQLAMLRSFDTTLRSLIAEHKTVDEHTIRARNYYLKLAKAKGDL